MPGTQPDFTDREFLDAVKNLSNPVTTEDVADYVGCTERNARIRLRRLHDQGQVGRDKIGNAHIWESV